jgi:uncharacterized protein (TIGR02996 family)
MTDDEAFIRAIVDRPGDDLPRLVYADWLDERGDPRGEYLRIEMELAKEAKKPQADGTVTFQWVELPDSGLDPVWVTRVSRPPAGVCCEHVRFTNGGPLLEPGDIDAVERRLTVLLPPDYRAFLLNYNGGNSEPHDMKTPTYPASPDWLTLRGFHPVIPPDEAESLNPDKTLGYGFEWTIGFVRQLAQEGCEDIVQGLLPIADTEFDMGYLFIDVRPTTAGRIYHFADYCHHADDPDGLVPVAGSVGELLWLIGRSAQFGAVHEV